MKKINLNKFAVGVSEFEGKAKELDISQIKEVLRITFEMLANDYMPSQALEAIERYGLK